MGLGTLVASPPRRLGEVAELDHPAGGDGFAQQSEELRVDTLLRAGPHDQTFRVRQRFEAGFQQCQGVGAHRGAQLRVQLPESGCTLPEAHPLQSLGGGGECGQLLCL